MSVYIKEFDGYIADNPNLDFERCDGKVFSYYEVNTANMAAAANTLTITGGQGNYPLAYIDTDRTLEFTFASSQFTLDMFAMANAANIENGDFGTLETKRYDVATGLKITIPYEVKEGSVYIAGYTEASAAAAGKFKVTITPAAAETAGKTEITFYEGDQAIGDTLRVSYKRRLVNTEKVDVTTNSTTAKGALYAHYPIYSSGGDCTEAAIKAWLHVYLPRVRATALPGFDNSYKSASTNSVTFAAIDPKRGDNKMYALYYEPLDENGEIVTKSAAQVEWE